MNNKILLTCEHGDAVVPAAYKKLFAGKAAVLKTHRGLDIGALGIARSLQKIIKAPLEACTVSRLVIDTNRFLGSKTLFSEFTSGLPDEARQRLIDLYYQPHWNRVIARAEKIKKSRAQIIHIAVHSMTDKLHGKTRPMQLALLYDPKRQVEKDFARLWIQELRRIFPNFKIARNNPYKGDGEGLTTFLRRRHSEKSYVGIELEMNQKLFRDLKTTAQKNQLAEGLAKALAIATEKFKLET